jgi:hypothetical protein
MGALGIHQNWQHKGWRRWFNSIFHGEITKEHFNFLVPLYREQIARITAAKLLVASLLQVALLGIAYGREREEEITFPWQNERGKKLMVRTGIYGEDGAEKYIDFLAFREVGDLLAWVAGPGKRFKAKAAFIPKTLMELYSNEDWSGQPITGGEGIPFHQRIRDQLGHVAQTALPSFARTDRRPMMNRPADVLGTAAGIQFRRGRPLQPGATMELNMSLRKAQQQKSYNDQKVRKRMRGMVPGEPRALRMIGVGKGKITPQQYRSWAQSFYLPQQQ